MANIDERIVKMVFDNKSFEKNIKQTSESLASLKQDLKLEGLATNVQSIADRFSTLGIVGMTVLQDITRMAIDTGKKIANAILSPMMEGGKKRALNIEHAMFQFEGLGMDVEAAMESANTAVLGTAFGLDEAAKVAAQFGASGMKAGEDMTSALTAISGVAAMTGGTYEDIGRIFIKVAGNGRLMGQELLQLSGRGINAAATLADELGITEQEVRKMVSKGQISFEMFYRAMESAFGEHATKANETFVGAMSNMKAALSRIGADFYGPFLVSMRHVMNTIRPVIDGVRKAIGPLVEYVVTLVDDLSKSFITKLEGLDPSNITQYIQPILTLLENLYSVAKSVLTPIKEAFRNIFPKKSHDAMVNGITALGEFISKFELSAETAKKVGKIFQGFFSIFDTIKNIVIDVAKALWGALGPTIITIGNYILDFGVKVSDVLIRFNEWWKESETLQKVLDGLSRFLKKFVEGALTAITWSLDKIRGLFSKVGAAGASFGEALSSAFKFVSDSLKKIGLVETLGKLWEIVKSVTSGAWQAVKKMAGGLGEVFKELSFDNVLKTLNTGGFLLLVDSLKRKIDAPGPFSKLKFRLTIFKNIFDTINKALQALVLNIHADSLKKIAVAVLILAGGLLVISMIDADRLADSVAAITLLFTNLMGMMALMLKMQSGGSLGFKGILDSVAFDRMAKSLTSMATAVLILSAALALVSNIDPKDMMKGLAAITAMAAILVATIYALKKIDAKRLGGVAIAMVFFSTSMVIMGKAVANLGKLSWGEIAKGLVSITVLLAAIVGFSKFVNNKKMASIGIGMVVIATSMLIFSRAMRKIAELSWEEIAKGLVGIGGALLVIAGSMKLMPKGSTMLAMSTALIAVGIALQLITRSVKQFGGMSWEQLAKGLIGLAGALLILAGALHAMKGTLSGSAALLVATSSLIILVPVMKSLGKMSWGSIIRSLVALAGALTIFGVAAYALQPVTGTLLAMGAAMALFGVGLALVGVGISSAAIGLTTLAKAIAATVGALKEAIVHIVDLVVTLVVEITKGLVEAVPALFELIGALLDELLPFLKTRVPEIIATILDTMIDSLKNIADRIPALVDVGIQVVLGIVEGITNSLDDIAQALINLIVKAINAVTKAVSNATSGIATAIADLLRVFVQLIFEVFKALLDLPSGETLPVIETVSTAILALSGAMFLASKVPVSGAISGALGLAAFIGIFAGILAALGSLSAIPGVKELLSNGSALLNQLGGALGEFVGSIIGGFGAGITSALPEIGANLSLFMTQLDPFISGMKKIDSAMLASTGILVAVMLLLTGASLIEGLTNFIFGTRNSLVDFGQELAEFGPYFNKYYQTIKNIKPEVVSASALAAGALAELATNLPKHGGFAQTILGEASLESFGESLVSFGASLMAYQKALGAGLDADLITDSATAAQALAALESNLPSHGGVKSWFMGDADLGSFGVHLEDFGKALKGYHDSLGSGIDSNLITDSATAALALAELEDNLPKQGGIKSWFSGTKSLGKFGKNLGDFGTALADYQKALGTKGLDTKMIISSATAAKALSELEDNLPKQGGIKSWFTGSASLGSFGKNLKDFGYALADYQKALGTGLDSDLITASVTAAQALSELEANLPNQNGIKSWFIGGADLGSFGANLKDFGTALKDYQEALGDGIDGDLIVASANAAGALSELEDNLPEHGGVVQFWSGDNTLGEFAKGLAPFGEGMKDFQEALGDGIDGELINDAANAAGALAELEANLPEHGGVVQFWSGDASLGEFAKGLAPFGEGMKDFQEALGDGIDGELINDAANAGLALAKLEENLPATGGVVQFWAGDNTLGEFAKGLAPFGEGMKAFHDALGDGIDTTLIDNAANAGLTLAELEATLPATGGVVQFWSGSNTLGEFAEGLEPFGEGMKAFYDALGDGIDTTLIDNAANAGLTLAELEATLPATGGVVQFWSGEASLGEFAKGLEPFGTGMKAFHDALGDGIDGDLIESAANAGLTIAELEATLPKQDGAVSFWSGKGTTLSEFAKELAPFGEGMNAFDEALGEIDIGLVDSAANAGKTLSAIAAEQPSFGGLVEIWGGKKTGLKEFGENLELFGESLVKYGDSVESIKIDSIISAMPAVNALVELAGKLEGDKGGLKSLWSSDYNFKHLGTELKSFGDSLSEYSDSIVNLNTGKMANVNRIIDGLIKIAKDMVGIQDMPMTRFGNDLRNLGETGMTGYIDAFENAENDISKSIETLMTSAKDSITEQQPSLKAEMHKAMASLNVAISEATSEFKLTAVIIPLSIIKAIKDTSAALNLAGASMILDISNGMKENEHLLNNVILEPISKMAIELRNQSVGFTAVGGDLVTGFIRGITINTFRAEAAARAMAGAALAAAKRRLDIRSPSKAFSKEVGQMIARGTAEGIKRDKHKAVGEASEMSASILSAARDFISDKKHYNQLTLKEEEFVLRETLKKLKSNSEERKEVLRDLYTIEKQRKSEWLSDQMFYNKLSLQGEINYWKARLKENKKGTDAYKEAQREIYTLECELEEARISDRKFYNQLTWTEEVAFWKRRLKQAKKGTEEYNEIARTIYTLENDRRLENIQNRRHYQMTGIEAELAYWKKMRDAAASGSQGYYDINKQVYDLEKEIEDRRLEDLKFYNKLSLQDELDYYKKKIKLYHRNSDAYRQMAKDIYTLENQMADNIKSANKEYEDAIKSRADAIYSSYGLFDKGAKRGQISGERLTENLEHQVKSLEEWQDLILSLGKRNLDSTLMDELIKMGPGAMGELRGLNAMTEKELNKYNALWTRKRSFADEAAVKEIGVSQSLANELTDINRRFLETMGLLSDDSDDAMHGVINNALGNLESISNALKPVMTNMTSSIDTKEISKNLVKNIDNSLKKDKDKIVELGAQIGRAIQEGIVKESKSYWEDRENIIGLEQTLFMIQEIIARGLDGPTITPVINMSEVERGIRDINSLFDSDRQYTRHLAYSAADSTRDYMNISRQSSILSKLGKGTENNYTIQIDVQGDGLSRENIRSIAIDIEREIKQMNDRLSLSKGEEVVF